MREAIIHIGTEKTGSTTLQHFLEINREPLRKAGIYTPTTTGSPNQLKLAAFCIGDDPDPEQNSLLSLLGIHDLEQHTTWKHSFRDTLGKELAALAPEAKVIFSSEHLQSRVKRTAEIEQLRILLEPYFEHFRIVVYLRRQDQVASSLYNEALKSGSTGKRPLVAHGKIDERFFEYNKWLDQWSAVFGPTQLSPRLFEQEQFVGNSLVADFCHSCDISYEKDYKIPPSKNVALTGDTQHMLIRFNQLSRLVNKGNPTFVALRRYIIQNQREKTEFPALRSTTAEAEMFLNKYRASNRKLAVRWLEGEQFSNDMSMYSNTSGVFPDRAYVDSMLAREIEEFCKKATKKKKDIGIDPADMHRDIGILVEHLDFELAIKHMRIALSLRPDGPYIKHKLDLYLKQSKAASTELSDHS